jgi:hypothetical protein
MAKAQSPLLGYNTNIRHKGKVFHIQTEDSGITKPHVMTHLFADGGRILKSQKTSYAHLLEADDLATQVKKLMQDQHKAMFIALRQGQFDEMAGVEVSPAAAVAVAPAPDPVESELETGESNTVPPTSPTPLNPSAVMLAQPPPPPRSNLPAVPSVLPPPPVAVAVVRPALFGDSLVSDRSLDEVILAFLAEELESSGTA